MIPKPVHVGRPIKYDIMPDLWALSVGQCLRVKPSDFDSGTETTALIDRLRHSVSDQSRGTYQAAYQTLEDGSVMIRRTK